MGLFTEIEREHFAKQGYVIIKDVLSEKEVEEIRRIIVKLADWEREQGCAFLYGDNKLQRIWNLMNKHVVFRELIQKPIVLEMMNYLFQDNFILRSWTANIVYGGGAAGGLHIDTHVADPVPPYLLEANTMWLLDDFTEWNGATLCLPGSHHFLRNPKQEDQQRADLVKLIAPKGSIVLTHGALWHASGQNETEQERSVLLGSFAPAYVRGLGVQEEHLLIIDKDIIEQSSPILQKMIGVGAGIHEGAMQKPPEFK